MLNTTQFHELSRRRKNLYVLRLYVGLVDGECYSITEIAKRYQRSAYVIRNRYMSALHQVTYIYNQAYPENAKTFPYWWTSNNYALPIAKEKRKKYGPIFEHVIEHIERYTR